MICNRASILMILYFINSFQESTSTTINWMHMSPEDIFSESAFMDIIPPEMCKDTPHTDITIVEPRGTPEEISKREED